MLISKFKGIAYSPIILSPLILILVFASYYFSEDGASSTVFLVSIGILVLWVVLIYYMLQNYFISIKIYNNDINVQSILGKGNPKNFLMSSLDGYKLEKQSGENASSEVIFIYYHGKIVIRISELFYQNYPAIKKAISQKLKRIPN